MDRLFHGRISIFGRIIVVVVVLVIDNVIVILFFDTWLFIRSFECIHCLDIISVLLTFFHEIRRRCWFQMGIQFLIIFMFSVPVGFLVPPFSFVIFRFTFLIINLFLFLCLFSCSFIDLEMWINLSIFVYVIHLGNLFFFLHNVSYSIIELLNLKLLSTR